ncbi:MAG: hypothetical protein II999_06965 [Bacteroidaceae bacterium]|nr:hypothetical protein [Bacteroidaceae bacterium]
MSKITRGVAIFAMALITVPLTAQEEVTLNGSIQSDILLPQEDNKIGTKYDSNSDLLTNTYVDLHLRSHYIDAGARLEYMDYPLPGFETDFQGWGVPHMYVKAKFDQGVDVTFGDFYDQFGSGFIFRAYEERSLGIDNSLRGLRLNITGIKGLNLKVLGGAQRRYWEWDDKTLVGGADAEVNIEQYSQKMQDKGVSWMVGASFVGKKEEDEMIMLNPVQRLNLPKFVTAFDVRSRFQKGNYSLMAEYAMKSQDPSFDNGYIYKKGNALMLSASYSKRGMSALVQAKRSEDMSFRSRRSVNGTSVFLNHMPAFAYQHTYALAALYPYATQMAGGEWAMQGEFGYTFKRNTLLGGKYGTNLKLNISYIRAIDKEPVAADKLMGTDGYTSSFFKFGDETYYQDINVQLEKKFTKAFKMNLMYMNQRYNQSVIEGHGGMINSNIFVGEGKYQFNKKFTLRGELQYLTTPHESGDWMYGLLELSVLPYLMFTVSDMYGKPSVNGGLEYAGKEHYYMASVTFNYNAHRIMAGYGRTRAGYNCSGGVCRYVPASRGVNISYNYSF